MIHVDIVSTIYYIIYIEYCFKFSLKSIVFITDNHHKTTDELSVYCSKDLANDIRNKML